MSDNKRLKDYDDLPLVLDVADIRRIMGISRVSAYELVHTPGFPAFRSGRLIKVSKRRSLTGWKRVRKPYRKATNERMVSFPVWNTAPFSKAHTEGKNLENGTETLHKTVYLRMPDRNGERSQLRRE